ncbi:LuxR C-terminal-related transcriptional regulator [Hyphomicrobium sp. MC8b]|uniref:LuxR C-terminal-related transcriptional regulator n=1 Tax=Hyphomicrobium sp. MC8b TaxID=300273 RepID=UPI00391C4F68
MAGFTNEAVAKRLGIGTGTVKNHRKRLYFKLDITTERELFTMFLESLLESTDHIAIRQSETAESALSNVVPYPPRVARRRSADGAQGSSKDR